MDNKKHGYGVFTFTTGEKYEGMWRDDKQHGKGKYTYASGNVYDGTISISPIAMTTGGVGIFRESHDLTTQATGSMTRSPAWAPTAGSTARGNPSPLTALLRFRSLCECAVGAYMFFECVTRFEGRWRANKKHGQGKLFFADGESAMQWYDDGKLIKQEGDSDDDTDTGSD